MTRAEIDAAFAALGRVVVTETRDNCVDVDGGWLQEKACDLGLLVRRTDETGMLQHCGEFCEWVPGMPVDECCCWFEVEATD